MTTPDVPPTERPGRSGSPVPAAPGRRSATASGGARGRLDRIVLLAVLVPLLTVLAAYAVHAGAEPTSPTRLSESPLDRATVICPGGGSTDEISTLADGSGQVTVRVGRDQQRVTVRPHRSTTVPGQDQPLVIGAEGDLAPGLLAASFATPLAAADCQAPSADQWFTGAGAGAKHTSYLELVNPDAGRALVDVQVLGRKGLVDVPQLRGVAVPGGQDVRLDLGRIVPRRDDLALHVTTIRGRVFAALADSFDELGGGDQGADWIASQAAPSTRNLMLGLPPGSGQRTLVVANPGDTEARATVRLVSPQSVFTPQGATEVALPPQSVVRVPLAGLLRGAGTAAAERPLGLEVDSTAPTTAGLVLFVDGDLTHAVPLTSLTGEGAALLPDGHPQLLLAGATGPGVVTVSSWTATGKPLDDTRVAVEAGRGYPVRLPRKARLLTVTPQRTAISAAVLVSGDGVTEVPVRQPPMTGLVPDVRPGQP